MMMDNCKSAKQCILVDQGFVEEVIRVRNLKFATYLKFATCGNTNKINEFR